jgi:NAD(P)H-dependent flavin oxidoreductase YrpB (nitropropane dioxygenase family)
VAADNRGMNTLAQRLNAAACCCRPPWPARRARPWRWRSASRRRHRRPARRHAHARGAGAGADRAVARHHRPWNVNFFCHTPPAPDAAREARWREALAPFYAEAGLDIAAVPAGAGRVPFSHAVADAVEPFRPPIVSFHFGLPAPDLLARVKGWGSVVLSSATTVDEAHLARSAGGGRGDRAGLEAGGHRGMFLSTTT